MALGLHAPSPPTAAHKLLAPTTYEAIVSSMDQLLIKRIDKYIHSTLLHHCLHNDNHANHIGVCNHTRNVARVARPFPLTYKPQHIYRMGEGEWV